MIYNKQVQSSAYRSQRCSGCGIVRKQNRIGKVYKCNNCNLIVCISIIKLPFFCRRCKKCKSKLELIERNVFDFWRK